ncbi:MAG: c-type cytochrome [Bacteroidota bacterium]
MHKAFNILIVVAVLVLVMGCNDMADQARVKPLEESKHFADRQSSRTLPEGTVARGHLREDALLYTGKINGVFADQFPFPVDEELMNRGENRYNTFCTPCHGRLGDGMGMIVQRGFPKPNSFHSDSLRLKPAGYYVDVIANGFGRMYSYAASVPVNDRWAIVAYIRALQLSRRVPLKNLSPDEQQRIAGQMK